MEWLGRSVCYNHYLWDWWLLPNRFWLLRSHEINATLEGHRQVLSFARTIDRGRTKPRPPIDSYLPKFFQVEASSRRSCRRKTGPNITIQIPDRIVLLNFEWSGWDGIGAIVPVVNYVINIQSRDNPVRTPNQNEPEYQRSTSES